MSLRFHKATAYERNNALNNVVPIKNNVTSHLSQQQAETTREVSYGFASARSAWPLGLIVMRIQGWIQHMNFSVFPFLTTGPGTD